MNKQPFTELDTGWLAPNGDFYPCDYMEHLATADELIGEWVKRRCSTWAGVRFIA